ncbi:unnamed protein product [Paramecium sonneborni]|uniref:Uncharacterized protein n=1 Tax=Paramecium sonneborni TaxID=65129 RepID=A0A8S1RVC2_9CILI|nr:unnamed protein product [Paramecium sonneborni]
MEYSEKDDDNSQENSDDWQKTDISQHQENRLKQLAKGIHDMFQLYETLRMRNVKNTIF